MNNWKYTIVIVVFSVLVGLGCQTPEGPTFKQKVDEALALYYQGLELERNGDYESALEKYMQSLEVTPRPRVYFQLASVQVALAEFDAALQSLNQALELSPGFGEARLKSEQLKQLIARQEDSVNAPLSPQAVYDGLSMQGPVRREAATPTTPPQVTTPTPTPTPVPEPSYDEDTQSLIEEAHAAMAAKSWDKAVQIYRDVRQRYSNDAELRYRYGYALLQQGNLAEAEKELLLVVEMDPSRADAYNDLGVVLENRGRSAQAIQYYEKAIELGGSASAYFNLAALQEKLGNYRTAIVLYQQFIEQENTENPFVQRARDRIEKLNRKVY